MTERDSLYRCIKKKCSHASCGLVSRFASVIPYSTNFIDDPELVGEIFVVPQRLAQSGMRNSVALDFDEIASDPDSDAVFCYACELFASSIGATVTDHARLALADNPGTVACAERATWISGSGDARRSESVAAAVFGMAARGSAHRSLEVLAFLVGEYSKLKPNDTSCSPREYLSSDTLVTDYIRRISEKVPWMRLIASVAVNLIPPPPSTPAQKLAASRLEDALSSVELSEDPNDPENKKKYSRAASQCGSCRCGISWLKTQVTRSPTRTITMISCVASSIGIQGCGERLLYVV